jgi:hypothetical protein
MDEYDVYYVDGRNAYRDPRTGRVMQGNPPWMQQRSMMGPQHYGQNHGQHYGQSPMMGPHPYPQWGPQGPGYYGPGVPPPGIMAQQGPLGSSLLGRISTGQLIDLIAQVFAALNPLPAQPVATNDAATDVGNLILYQGSLASYAKKDEQIRTLGHLVGKLVA